jgi:RHS repeat-associated protein
MVGEEQGHYPFGEPWYETSPETTRIFTTYEREAGGSLDYAMFRWMGPEAGRFLSADPVHGSMGDGQSWNRYAYGKNDPVNLADPFGLRPSPFHRSHDPGFGLGSGGPGGGGGFGYLPWDMDLEIALGHTRDEPWNFFPGLNSKLRVHLWEQGNRFITLTPIESAWVLSGASGTDVTTRAAANPCSLPDAMHEDGTGDPVVRHFHALNKRGGYLDAGDEYNMEFYQFMRVEAGGTSAVPVGPVRTAYPPADGTTVWFWAEPPGESWTAFWHTHPFGEFAGYVSPADWSAAKQHGEKTFYIFWAAGAVRYSGSGDVTCLDVKW